MKTFIHIIYHLPNFSQSPGLIMHLMSFQPMKWFTGNYIQTFIVIPPIHTNSMLLSLDILPDL